MSHDIEGPIKIVAIGGSVSASNNTAKALAVAVDEVSKQPDTTVRVFHPADIELPLPGAGEAGESTREMADAVMAATGVILATPEYHGSYSSVLKLVIDNLGYPSNLSGKPVALIGVAAGQIGAVKALEHLRSVCSHVGAIVLPGPASVAGVHKAFDENGNCVDEAVEKRLRAAGTRLVEYIRDHICPKAALENMVRNSSA